MHLTWEPGCPPAARAARADPPARVGPRSLARPIVPGKWWFLP